MFGTDFHPAATMVGVATTGPVREGSRRRYEERREAVIDAAARAFAKQGYDATTIDDLVVATGLQRGGLYHYIGGKRVPGNERFEDRSPIDEELLAEVARGGEREVRDAVEAAVNAFPGWAGLGIAGRAAHLRRLADLIDANVERIASVECLDMAMLERSLRARVIPRGARNYRSYAELAEGHEDRVWSSNSTRNCVLRMPAGPAAVVTPPVPMLGSASSASRPLSKLETL